MKKINKEYVSIVEFRMNYIREIQSIQDKLYGKHFDTNLFDGNDINELRNILINIDIEYNDSILLKEGRELSLFTGGMLYSYGTIIKSGTSDLMSKYPVEIKEYGIKKEGEHIVVLYHKLNKSVVSFLLVGSTGDDRSIYNCIYRSIVV